MNNASLELRFHAGAILNVPGSSSRVSVPYPEPKDCLKYEEKTLIWASELDCGDRAIFKMYCHRGPIHRLREKIFRFRVEREYDALAYLCEAGVLCPEPFFWGYGSSATHGRFEVLATREISGAVPLKQTLRTSQKAGVDWELLSDSVRRMHQRGVYHGALSSKNILLRSDGGGAFTPYIHDLAKTIIFPNSIIGTRMAWFDLLNLTQTVVAHASVASCRRLLRHYGLGDQLTEGFLNHLQAKYRPSKHLRNRLQGEFKIRKLLAGLRNGKMSALSFLTGALVYLPQVADDAFLGLL